MGPHNPSCRLQFAVLGFNSKNIQWETKTEFNSVSSSREHTFQVFIHAESQISVCLIEGVDFSDVIN